MTPRQAAKLDHGPDGLRTDHLIVDRSHDYVAIGGIAYCRLRIYRCNNLSLVVFTEEPGNDGTSVINWIEELAAEVINTYNLGPMHTLFFDHHAPGYFATHGNDAEEGEETISLAVLNWYQRAAKYRASGVQWVHVYSKLHPTDQPKNIAQVRDWLLDQEYLPAWTEIETTARNILAESKRLSPGQLLDASA